MPAIPSSKPGRKELDGFDHHDGDDNDNDERSFLDGQWLSPFLEKAAKQLVEIHKVLLAP